MSDETLTPEAQTSEELTPTDLQDSLRELGEALPVSSQPNAHDAGPLLAGVIFYLATGSLIAPKIDVPTQAEVTADLQEQTRLNEAEAKVAELERKLAAQSAGPAAVAPAPVAAVPEPQPPAAAPVATEPAPVAPVEPTAPAQTAAPAAPVDPATATPAPPAEGTVGS